MNASSTEHGSSLNPHSERGVGQAPCSVGDDSLEAVQQEIDEFKAEALSGRGKGSEDAAVSVTPASSHERLPPRPESVFACSIDESCGYGDELLCLCRDPEAKPWVPCPLHEGG